jgi:hypothetical protein
MMDKYCFYFLVFFAINVAFGQNNSVDTKKLDELVRLKNEMINDYEIKSFYTIQLYSGKKNNAEEVKSNYDDKAFKYKAIIEYDTPNYKVWVGRFRTKLEADKAFSQIKEYYPSGLIFRPGR